MISAHEPRNSTISLLPPVGPSYSLPPSLAHSLSLSLFDSLSMLTSIFVGQLLHTSQPVTLIEFISDLCHIYRFIPGLEFIQSRGTLSSIAEGWRESWWSSRCVLMALFDGYSAVIRERDLECRSKVIRITFACATLRNRGSGGVDVVLYLDRRVTGATVEAWAIDCARLPSPPRVTRYERSPLLRLSHVVSGLSYSRYRWNSTNRLLLPVP